MQLGEVKCRITCIPDGCPVQLRDTAMGAPKREGPQSPPGLPELQFSRAEDFSSVRERCHELMVNLQKASP